jgi:hypothetical protein
MALFGVAALVGIGYVVGKKIVERRNEEEDWLDLEDFTDEELEDLIDDDIDVGVYAKSSSFGDKCKKASLFAVGAIKTGADKLGETISDIKTKDMVKKGEQTVGAVKETGDNIKNDIKRDIEDLKDMVASINDEDLKEADADDIKDLFGDDDIKD